MGTDHPSLGILIPKSGTPNNLQFSEYKIDLPQGTKKLNH